MTHQWMAGLLGLGLGFVTMGSAIATPSQAPYNCFTREVWSPEKQAWCQANAPVFNPVEAVVEPGSDAISQVVLADQLQQTDWLLEDLNGTGVVDGIQTTLQIAEDNRIGGSGGCNRYFSSIQFNPDGATALSQTVTMDVVGSTQMACLPAVMDQEGRYFQSLQTAQRMELDGPYLYIYSEGQEQPMRFTQITATPAQPVQGLW